jgi:hypothetical protein
MKKIIFLLLIIVSGLSCKKNKDTSTTTQNNGGNTGSQDTNCLLATVSQVNSGAGIESSLSASYNSNDQITRLIIYDSVNRTKNFQADFSYITADSVRIDAYQYLLLDGNKRISHFVTKSDLTNPSLADTYDFEYSYNIEGFLVTKNLFINSSKKANFSTVYTYTNQQLTGCLMTTPSAGNQKMLESTLSYDNSISIKNWIYTFPDAMEGYPYLAVLNFGKHVPNPLAKVVTKLYNPESGTLLDTWNTNYSNYKIDAAGHVLAGLASGDLQQGLASFFGKTNFYYTCH